MENNNNTQEEFSHRVKKATDFADEDRRAAEESIENEKAKIWMLALFASSYMDARHIPHQKFPGATCTIEPQ